MVERWTSGWRAWTSAARSSAVTWPAASSSASTSAVRALVTRPPMRRSSAWMRSVRSGSANEEGGEQAVLAEQEQHAEGQAEHAGDHADGGVDLEVPVGVEEAH